MAQMLQLDAELRASVTDSMGLIRLAKVRDSLHQISQDGIDVVQGLFLDWVQQPEYLLLRGTNFESGEQKFIGVKCSKRGNDVFNSRLDGKLGFLERLRLDKQYFFSISDFSPNKRVVARVLWITLTWDSKLCSLHQAWENVESDFNRWITNLRNHYGKISVWKHPQAFPDPQGQAYGFPHLHMVLIFHETDFSVFPSFDVGANGQEELNFRIHEKYELEAQGNWHSFIDVKAINSIGALANYCRKHAHGTHNVVAEDGSINEGALLNSAITWFYGKQTYSMSRDFRGQLLEFIEPLHDSKAFQGTLGKYICLNWDNRWGCRFGSDFKNHQKGKKGLSDLKCSAAEIAGSVEPGVEGLGIERGFSNSPCNGLAENCVCSGSFSVWKWEMLGFCSDVDLGIHPDVWTTEVSRSRAQEIQNKKKGSLWRDRWEN